MKNKKREVKMNIIHKIHRATIVATVLFFGSLTFAVAEEASDADLAQELTNPIADLMTIPIQMTYDQNIGQTMTARNCKQIFSP